MKGTAVNNQPIVMLTTKYKGVLFKQKSVLLTSSKSVRLFWYFTRVCFILLCLSRLCCLHFGALPLVPALAIA